MKPIVRYAFHTVPLLAIVFGPWPDSCLFAEVPPPLARAPFDGDQARLLQERWAKHTGKDMVHTNSIGMKLALLPPGEFIMGLTEEQFDANLARIKSDPKLAKNYRGAVVWSMLMMPAHRVRLTKPFYLGTTEVTVGQFRKFTDATGYRTEAERGLNAGVPYKGKRPISTWRKPMAWRTDYKPSDEEPVMHLCWNDCVAFCKWLGEKEGVEYGLPTEAEWEYACRAGTTTRWHFGDFAEADRVGHEYAWWSEPRQGRHDKPRPVGLGKPNAFGLYDMHGNMWEYVADWWHRFAYREAPLDDPTGPEVQSEKNDQRRIIRGSSFDWDRNGGESYYRMRITQRSNQHPHMTFRVVLRIKGVEGVPPAVDPDLERRRKKRDPGADAPEVTAALKQAAKEKHPKELTIDLGDGAKMEFVLLPAGTFLMGSEKGLPDEMPRHRVVISRPFYMAKYELTRAQWEALMGPHKGLAALTAGSKHMEGPTKAMNVLSWNDCQGFIRKLKAKAPGHAFALPTEAQWEYACRAGSTTEYHFGDDQSQLGAYAWFQGNMRWPGQSGYTGEAAYHDVGQKKPNPWGLHDMHGGVWEWCADRFDRDYYFSSPLVDPRGPESGRFHALRGGSWFRYGKYARSAYRRFFHPDGDGDGVTAWINDFGCRLVINFPEGPARSDLGKTPLWLAENLVKHEDNPVLDVGKPGAWDDQGLGCFSLSRVGDRFLLWYMGTGKSRKQWNIGLATSPDGLKWDRPLSKPVVGPGSMPGVLKDGATFYMLYPSGGGFTLTTSSDGIAWKPHGKNPVLRGTGASLDPCLRKFGDRFHLWYCGMAGKRYRLFHATSRDCIHWENEPTPILPLGESNTFDGKGHAGPEVLKVGDTWFLFYLGNDGKKWSAGVVTSTDGKHWKKSPANPVLDIGGPGDWDGGSLMSLDVHWRDGRFHVWYAAHAAAGRGRTEAEAGIRIGYATSRSLGGLTAPSSPPGGEAPPGGSTVP